MQIEWHDENSVGVQSIDKQHMRLVSIINDLFKAILADKAHDVLHSILEELAKYTAYHFSYEEHLLTKHGYPTHMLEEHIAEHRELTTRIYDFMVKFNAKEATIDLELYDFLRSWMEQHLCDTDKKYSGFLQSKGVE